MKESTEIRFDLFAHICNPSAHDVILILAGVTAYPRKAPRKKARDESVDVAVLVREHSGDEVVSGGGGVTG